MHIVILADPIDNQRAGVHTYTRKLVENLLKIDHENKYTFIHLKENDFFNDKNHYIIPKKTRLGYGSYRKFFLIPRLLKKLKADLVFEPCHIGPFRTKAKKAVMIHDLTPILMPQYHEKRSTIVHRLLMKRILKKSDLILTASKSTKEDINSYIGQSKQVSVVPLGIDFKHEETDMAFLLKRGYPKPKKQAKEPYILYLGTIEPRKNLETLIDAYLELKIPHKLIIAGEIGWKSAKIVNKAREAGIILTGFVDEEEKTKLYKNASAFIYPSFYEGFGLPPLEAMANGVPVICSNTGSLGEIFGDTALTFDPLDKAELKNCILAVLENTELHKELVEKGLKFAQNYSWKKTARETLKCFEELKT